MGGLGAAGDDASSTHTNTSDLSSPYLTSSSSSSVSALWSLSLDDFSSLDAENPTELAGGGLAGAETLFLRLSLSGQKDRDRRVGDVGSDLSAERLYC